MNRLTLVLGALVAGLAVYELAIGAYWAALGLGLFVLMLGWAAS